MKVLVSRPQLATFKAIPSLQAFGPDTASNHGAGYRWAYGSHLPVSSVNASDGADARRTSQTLAPPSTHGP
jgi:hypothetical protein